MPEQKRVLVAEDDAFLRSIYVTYLTQKNIEVIEAADGGQALDHAKRFSPDLILLDIMMPVMSGFEVLSRVKSSEEESVRNIPVVMLSNIWEDDDIEKARQLGADDYLFKAQVTPQEIYGRLGKYLGYDSDQKTGGMKFETVDETDDGEDKINPEDFGIKINQ